MHEYLDVITINYVLFRAILGENTDRWAIIFTRRLYSIQIRGFRYLQAIYRGSIQHAVQHTKNIERQVNHIYSPTVK